MREAESWEGHRERLRGRAVTEGFDALRESQMVELLLCYAVPRVDVSDVAKALTDRLGPLSKVLDASRETLMATPGMTRAMADWLMMTGELLRAYRSASRKGLYRIWRYWDVMLFLGPIWRDVPAPQTWMLYTDFEGSLLSKSVVCESLAWADPMCAAQIVEEALSMQARNAFLILFTGAEPQELTEYEQDYLVALSRTLRAIGVELLDCVMAGENGMVSLSREGRMEQVVRESEQLSLHEDYRRDE